MRVTRKMLDDRIETINNSRKYKTKFALYSAYGSVQLVKKNESGGISAITGLTTNKEIYTALQVLESIAYNFIELN